MAQPKNTLYIPKEVEPRWSYQLAEGNSSFEIDPTKKAFSVGFPLKPISSVLNLSQVLQYSLQDFYVRFKRMQGHLVHYVPGILYEDDEQMAFERRYKKSIVPIDQKQKYDFFQKEWTPWKERQIKGIVRHLQWMGISCDYQKLRFTLDEPYQQAIRSAFVQIYEDGILFSRQHIVHWCTECNSIVSPEDQIEKEEETLQYSIKLPLVPLKTVQKDKDKDKEIVLYLSFSLEHLELLFGIQGFLVPPSDDRFKKYIGRSVLIPVIEREVPIYTDIERVRGSEVFPIIPGHSHEGFRAAQKYNLRIHSVFSPNGMMNSLTGKEYEGLSREICRNKIIQHLKEKDLFKGQEFGTVQKVTKIKCFRCSESADLILFNRWYLKTNELIKKLEESLPEKESRLQRKMRGGRIGRFLEPLLKKEPHLPSGRRAKMFWKTIRIPKEWSITVPNWDGVPVPLWYCEICGGKAIASTTHLEKCPSCQGSKLRQEQGSVASKFGNWIWPLVLLGWPEKELPLYQQLAPNQLMISSETFEDLGRMVLSVAHLAQTTPFKTLYLSGTIQSVPRKEAHLSLESMIKRYGADSIRFSLLSLVSEGRNLKLSANWYRPGQKFVNKIWNLSLLVRKILPLEIPALEQDQELSFEDRWILSLLHRTLEKFTLLVEEFQFQKAMHILWKFVFKSLSFYLEMVKDALYLEHPESRNPPTDYIETLQRKQTAQHCIVEVFQILLKLTHIACPFVTEEIWFHLKTQCLSFSGKDLVYQKWPQYDSSKVDGTVELQMKYLSETICAIRKLLSLHGQGLARPRKMLIVPNDPNTYDILYKHQNLLRSFFHGELIQIQKIYTPNAKSIPEVLSDLTLYLELDHEVNFTQQLKKVDKELRRVSYEIERCKVHIGNREQEKFYRTVFPLVIARKKMLSSRYQRLKDYAEHLKRSRRKIL